MSLIEPILDLNLRHAAYRRGSLEIILTWILTTGRPCLVLVPTRMRPSHEDVTPCIVPLDSVWKWTEEVGDPAEAAKMSLQFADALGFNTLDPRTVMAIAAAVRDHISDLLQMPPLSLVAARETVADVIVTDLDTGKTKEQEITDVSE
ncbi:hypothetical protein DL1_08535 [Thioclava dalianensis]|uniref:Uncharacterized protein n=1 Tax=Thioclava dalianensis TaxID=1185766 RepID=A0A074TIH4_9RHOB|nr:hypothetical protein [Thioclava dalianensis]KEP68788.1 hypothetical protein DL1_08535 [Thioclava dalianensis]SFN49912.1 hypothetical protein SAMN05216224_10680 [Thioclava dalianensis]